MEDDMEWRPIETAPKRPLRASRQSDHFPTRNGEIIKHGPIIIVAFGYKGFEKWKSDVGYWSDYYKCWRFLEDDGPNDVQPTHWMPLPEPPLAKNGE
jgi:hypothetical protein